MAPRNPEPHSSTGCQASCGRCVVPVCHSPASSSRTAGLASTKRPMAPLSRRTALPCGQQSSRRLRVRTRRGSLRTSRTSSCTRPWQRGCAGTALPTRSSRVRTWRRSGNASRRACSSERHTATRAPRPRWPLCTLVAACTEAARQCRGACTTDRMCTNPEVLCTGPASLAPGLAAPGLAACTPAPLARWPHATVCALSIAQQEWQSP